MASNVASRPSSSERRGTPATDRSVGRGHGEPMTAPPSRSDRRSRRPGRRRWYADGAVQERSGDDGARGLPELVRARRRGVWVDLAVAVATAGRRVGATLGLHPLIAEDMLERNQRAEDRGDRRADPHRPVRARLRGRGHGAVEIDFVLGPGLPADRPRPRLGPAHGASPARRRRAAARRAARTTCCGRSPTTSSTATSRSPTGSATRSTRSRTTSSRAPDPRTLQRLFRAQARAHRGPPRDRAGARGLQPAHEPRLRADRRRRASSTSATCTTT